MGWWSKIRHRPRKDSGLVKGPLSVRAKYDSAQTTPDNRKHWANADTLTAAQAASPEVRRILRARARYEVANNSYARGIVLTLANDVVGTGPRLQVLSDDPRKNRLIEQEFAAWAKSVDLAGKLRTMRMARAQDGEAFAVIPVTDDAVGFELIEADRVTDGSATSATLADGITYDADGKPIEYKVVTDSNTYGILPLNYVTVSADYMVHWFRSDRPGQLRGLPDIMPALPLFAQLRRYTLAVLHAAESAADMAIFMKTNMPTDGQAADVDAMTEMEYTPNMAVFGPEGWEPIQIKAEQPVTTYKEFKGEILNEIARCLNMPFNIAACNSSGYNYSSGRLDHQTYYKSIRVEQLNLESVCLDRVLSIWLNENGYAKQAHQWFWDGHEHVDPEKEANAQSTRLTSNTTTLASEYARQGQDWDTELRQRAKEVALMKELGLTVAQAAPKPTNPTNEEDSQDGQEQDTSAA